MDGTDLLSVEFGVSGEEDFGDDDEVGGGEGGGELFHEEAGSGVLVGLEDADESLGVVGVAEGAEGGVDFSGVVSVVVDDGDAPPHLVVIFGGDDAYALHAAVETLEGVDGVGDGVPGGAESVCGDGGGGGVVGHVFAGEGHGVGGGVAMA